MIEDASFVFLFRLAYTLKKSVSEVLLLPEWERETWRFLFDLYGPMDWKREDLRTARVNQFQAVGGKPLKEFVLFPDPSERVEKDKEEELLHALGYYEES